MAPRRWGKSALVYKASKLAEAQNKQLKVITIDLFTIGDEQQFYEKLTREVLRKSSSKWEEWVKNGKEFIKSIVPVFSIGVDPYTEFEVKLNFQGKNYNVADILNLPERIAEAKKLKFVICIDEFQKLAQFENSLSLQQQLRSIWQYQQHTSYCLFGSKRHLISDMFQNQSMPFYRFGDTINLPKIKESHWYEFIFNSFKNHKKEIAPEHIQSILKYAQNQPYYVQQLSHHVFINTSKIVNEKTIQIAIDNIFDYNGIVYRRDIENLSSNQLGFLRALANEEKNLNSKETIAKYAVGTAGNIQRLKQAIESREMVDFYESAPQFIDPLFQLWIKMYVK
jgi:hypothetical protein